MRQKKPRKAEYKNLPHCLDHYPEWAGQWRKNLSTMGELWLELGCGNAYFSIEIAKKYPDVTVLAIDSNSARLWAGAKRAMAEGVENVWFMREKIEYLDTFFAENEIDKIWLTFPDPFPKKRHAKHRMTGIPFISAYHKILRPGGKFRFKTDNDALFDYTLEVLAEMGIEPTEQTTDLHSSDYLDEESSILTSYERRFIGEGLQINYLALEFE